jgi:ribosomal protein S12 methylthiotransferase accessory factor
MSDQEIKVTFPGGLRVDAEYKGYTVRTDQPVHAGGEGTALSPFDLFLTSIATCAGFYAVAFCRERGISTEKAGVVIKMEKAPGSKMIERIAIEIQLPVEFPEKYIRAIIKSVDSCTVKAHILKPPAFVIETRIPL